MDKLHSHCTFKFEDTNGHCPAGEAFSQEMITAGRIPVISCEGSCIRGEIARLAANLLAREDRYGRGCHGELLSVPQSGMAKWARQSDQIVVIDGCFLHCHGRLMSGIYPEERLNIFDALPYYGKYTDIMDVDDVPESERKKAAQMVFENVFNHLEGNPTESSDEADHKDQADHKDGVCCGLPRERSGCCG